MGSQRFEEDIVYSQEKVNWNRQNKEAIRKAIRNNSAVGFIVGKYDKDLTIVEVSDYFLYNLGYTFDGFMDDCKSSLKNVFFGENTHFLQKDRFQFIHGQGEGQILTHDHVPVHVRMFKTDFVSEENVKYWVLSVQMDWMQQNMHLVNDAIHSGFWYIECDEKGKDIHYIYSHEFRTMLGYRDILDFPNEKISWDGLIHPDDKARVEHALSTTLADKTDQMKYDIEYRMLVKNKGYQWFKDSGKVNRRIDGTASRMVGIFINIDKEKQAQKKQQRSDAFHRAYTEANLCEYYVNLKENTFESMKDEDTFLSSYEHASNWSNLVEGYVNDYVLDEYKDGILHLLDCSYIQKKEMQGKKEVNLECQILLHGQKQWVRNVVVCDEKSQYVIVFVRDITDAKIEAANIQAITNENKAMDLLIQGTVNLVDRYAMCDLVKNTYRFYNRKNTVVPYAFKGIYQDLIKEIASQFKIIEKDMSIEKALSVSQIQCMLKTQEDVYRFEYCTLDEKQIKSISITPLAFENKRVSQVLFITQDTTKEKKAEIEARKALKDAYEAANRASKAKTDFLSNMSHDIRTPMNAIVGMTAIAGANIENQDRVLDCLSKITLSSRHLLGLINEILDMSRIESGKLSLVDEEFNLSDLVDNIIAMNKTTMDLHRHTFEVRINKVEHEDVCGDSLRIQQLVTNILSNAIKYTPDGGNIEFTLSEINTNSRGLGCYEIVVKDNGIGISDEFQKIMFDPFTREDRKRTSKIQGTGLGMTIARNFAQMMNGDIRVKSKLGKGSEFTITIFLKLQDKKIEKIEQFINLPVLVVDDDIECCENTVSLLNEIGIDGEWVNTGQKAVQRTLERYKERKSYFAIIIDWKMPGMDGIETTRRIRKIVGKDVTIIVLSAYDYSQIEEEAKAAGVDEFISKPLFRSRLTATFKNIIRGKSNKTSKNSLFDIANSNYENKNILVVEDNELNGEIASEIIGMTGANVEVAMNGKYALEKVSKSSLNYYDLIFMDIQMPIMNGYEATLAIRSLKRKDVKSMPIIAMTANAFAEDVVLAKKAGMNEHITKPLDMNLLCEVLKKWL